MDGYIICKPYEYIFWETVQLFHFSQYNNSQFRNLLLHSQKHIYMYNKNYYNIGYHANVTKGAWNPLELVSPVSGALFKHLKFDKGFWCIGAKHQNAKYVSPNGTPRINAPLRQVTQALSLWTYALRDQSQASAHMKHTIRLNTFSYMLQLSSIFFKMI